MSIWRGILSSVIVVCLAAMLHAFPNEERASLSLGLQSATAMHLDSDNDLLYLVSGETISVLDLATFALATDADETPYDIASDEDLQGALQGIAASSNRDELYATQDGGYVLTYDLADLDTAPTQTTIADGKELTFIAIDESTSTLYIYNETDRSVIVYSPGTGSTTTAALTTDTEASFNVTNMRFIDGVSGTSGALYLSTDGGQLLVLAEGASVATAVTVDSELTDDLRGVAATPNSATLYIVNETDKVLHTMSTSNNALDSSTIDLSENSTLNAIDILDVTNPTETYAFVVGSLGVSVVDTDGNDVIDMNDGSEDDDEPLSISGAGAMVATEDEYLLVSHGDISVISDNPWITISSTSFGSGGSSLGLSDTLTLTFQSDELGDYTLRLGGDTDGSGSLLTDNVGSATGTIAAVDTDQSVTINYADHASSWVEGTNQVFIFVEDAEGNTGHRAAEITVDTPPSSVVIESVGFGGGKAYVNIQRLTADDISTYRVYADTDAATVLTKDTVSGSVAQATSGDTITVEVSGLTNGTTYFLAAEAVDAGGNVSAARTTTLSGGATATALPEATYGPAGFAGEAGCSLIPRRLP